MEKGRIEYIDSLKGFAMLCVVLGHIADGYLNSGLYPQAGQMLNVLLEVIYMFHMPLFIMISGYLYRMAYYTGTDCRTEKLKVQVLNVLSTYLLFSILMGLVKRVSGGFVNSQVSFRDILMIWAKPIYPYWYLYVMILLYLFFFAFRKKIDNKAFIWITLICCIFSNLLSTELYFEVFHFLYYMCFFYIGMIYQKNKNFILFRKQIVGISFLFSVVLTINYFVNGSQYNRLHRVPVVNLIVALGTCLFVWWCFEHIYVLTKNKLFLLCGKYCLEIYVIHCFFTAGNRALFARMGIGNVYVSIILNMVISTAVPILFSMICKKLGLHGLFFKTYSFIKSKITI